MKLRSSTLSNLAKFICGDNLVGIFPYRSSSYLTSFFESIDLDYTHDGSTRYYWVKSVLEELNNNPSENENIPSPEIIKVIEHLLHPDYYVDLSKESKESAINQVNNILKSYELEVIENHKTGLVKLNINTGNFISSSISEFNAEKKITFTPSIFKIPELDPKSNLISVMMPFSADFDSVYEAIKSVSVENGFVCYRADDIWANSTIIQDIFDLIFCSKIVIIDYTNKNSNVMYETGIAHTLGKIVIPITQSLDDIPFDLKPHRSLKYLSNNEGLFELKDNLSKRIKTLVQGHSW